MHKLLSLGLVLVFALTFITGYTDEADSIIVDSCKVSYNIADTMSKEQILLSKLKSTEQRLATAQNTTLIDEGDVFESEIDLVIAQDETDDLANEPEIELVIAKTEAEEDSLPEVLTFDPIEYSMNGENPVCEECEQKFANEALSTAEDIPQADETDEASHPIVFNLDPIEYNVNGENPVCEQCAENCVDNAI